MRKVIVLGLGTAMAMVLFLPAMNVVHVSPAGAARPAALPRCLNYQLLVRAQGSQGAAGHIAVIYRMHNLFNQACRLYGYPGVQLLDRNFLSLKTTVHRGAGNLVGGSKPRPVRLAPFGNAYFALGYSDVPVNGLCQPAAHYVMITPPDAYLPVVTYAFTNGGTIYSCTGDINVSPVTATPRYG